MSAEPSVITVSAEKAWTRGFASAVVEMVRASSHSSIETARAVCKQAGLSLSDFREAGVEPIDLSLLRKVLT